MLSSIIGRHSEARSLRPSPGSTAVSAPAAQPAHVPIAEARPQRDWCTKAQELGVELHGVDRGSRAGAKSSWPSGVPRSSPAGRLVHRSIISGLRGAPPQFIEEVLQKDHVGLHLLIFRLFDRHERSDALAVRREIVAREEDRCSRAASRTTPAACRQALDDFFRWCEGAAVGEFTKAEVTTYRPEWYVSYHH
jgi:hypothetical protein